MARENLKKAKNVKSVTKNYSEMRAFPHRRPGAAKGKGGFSFKVKNTLMGLAFFGQSHKSGIAARKNKKNS